MLVGIPGDRGERDTSLPTVLDGVADYPRRLGRSFDRLLHVGDLARGRTLFDEGWVAGREHNVWPLPPR